MSLHAQWVLHDLIMFLFVAVVVTPLSLSWMWVAQHCTSQDIAIFCVELTQHFDLIIVWELVL